MRVYKYWKLMAGLVLLSLLATPCMAAQVNAVARMQAFLSRVHSLKADFTQVVLDANLQTIKQSSGTLAIKRPNRFRWDYAAPNREVIDADGRRVWIYDVELQQVTVKSLTGTLAASPAVLLAGSNDVQQNLPSKIWGPKTAWNGSASPPRSRIRISRVCAWVSAGTWWRPWSSRMPSVT